VEELVLVSGNGGEGGGLDGGFKGSEERKWRRVSVEFMSLGRGWGGV